MSWLCRNCVVAFVLGSALVLGGQSAALADVLSGGQPDPTFSSFYAWYDAGNGPVTSGGSLTSWADRLDKPSDGSRDLTSVVGTAPTLGTTGTLNDQPTVNFNNNGGIRRVAADWGTISQPNTFFFVSTSTTDSGQYFDGASGNEGYGRNTMATGGGAPVLYAGAELAIPSYPFGAYCVNTAVFNGASSLVRVNGSQLAAGDVGSQDLQGLSLSTNTMGEAGASFYLSGSIAEILVYDAALSTSDIQAVEGYLNNKYFVPEPSVLALLVTGMFGILAYAWRKRR